MIRTSLILPESLHQRLQILSSQEEKNLSQLIRDLLDMALAEQDQTHLQRLYRGLREARGTGNTGIIDASATIDETLYGKDGAWKGENAK